MFNYLRIFLILTGLVVFVSCSSPTSTGAKGGDGNTGGVTPPDPGENPDEPEIPDHPFINVDALDNTTWTGTNSSTGGTWVAVKFVKTGDKTLDAYFGEGGDQGTAIKNLTKLANTKLDPNNNALSFDKYKFDFKSESRSILTSGKNTISDNLAKTNQ